MNKNTFKTVITILGGSLFGLALMLGVTYSFNIPSAHAALGDGSSIDDGGGTEPGDPSFTPSVSMTASPATIESGYSSQLLFSSQGMEGCTIDNGVGVVAANMSSSRTVSPTQTTTYTISCFDSFNAYYDAVTITVAPAPTPLAAYCSAGPDTAQIGETVQWSANPSTGGSSGTLTWKEGAPFTTKVCSGGQNGTGLNNTCAEDVTDGSSCTVEGARCRISSGCDGNTYTDSSGQPNSNTAYGSVIPYTCTSSTGSTTTYTYAWSGTDGLSGATQFVSKAYSTTGTKSGQVTISANTGGSAVATCTANVVGQSPTATLTASPSSITVGSASTLTWGSTNAASCSLNESIGTVVTSGTRSVSPGSTTTYTLICSAPGSGSTSGTWQYFGDDYSDFSCPLTDMNKAYSSTPNCPSSPAGKSCTGSGMCKINTVAGNPACTIHTVLYSCEGGGASTPPQYATASATVTVTPAPAVSCSASATSVLPGASVTYTANPSNGAGAPYSWSSTSGSGFGTAATATRTFTNQGNYNMSVSASGASANCPLVTVNACPGARTATINADRTRVNINDTVTLTWQAGGINTSCIVTGPTGTLYTSNATSCNVPDGSVTTAVAGQSTYTISCDSGTVTDSVIVNVVPNFEEF